MSEMILNRRSMIAGMMAAGAAPMIVNRGAHADSKPRNVLLIISDDHGLDTPSYGNPVIQTPHLEQLASEGVRFTNAFGTTASCSPSRSVILTGLHNHCNGTYGLTHREHNFRKLAEYRTLPFMLQQAGYRTGVIGKLHVAPEADYPFDYVGRIGTGGGRSVMRMGELAEEFFQESGDQPFFLLHGFVDPHRSRPPGDFGNENEYLGVEEVTYSPEDVIVPDYLPDIPETREELAEYYQSVTRMDAGVGAVMSALKRSGKADNTLVIYISDNGPAFPGAKASVTDGGLHLPMIVSAPGVEGGSVNHAMVSFTDLTPTILDWAGVAAPEEYPLHGRSMLPILGQSNPSGWDEVYFSHSFHEITMYYPSRGIRTPRFKYIHNLAHQLTHPLASDLYRSKTWQAILRDRLEYSGKRRVEDFLYRPEEELYHVEFDPAETKNLVNDPAYRAVLMHLRAKTVKFRQNTRDIWYTDRITHHADQLIEE